MIKFALRALMTALVFTYIFPMVSGVHFTGALWPEGIVYGVLMAVVASVFAFAAFAFTAVTFGLGGILLFFGFWLIPAIELKALAHFFPQHLAFDGWGSAIIAGLILMVINLLTHSKRSNSSSR